MDINSFDTETFLISPGCGAPPMVTHQWRINKDRADIIHARDPATRRITQELLERTFLNGHNLAFDMAVLCAYDPDFIPLVFRAYNENRAVCTAIRERLRDIAVGEFEGRIPGQSDEEEPTKRKWGYSLAEVALRNSDGAIILDKTDPWRLRYGTLYHTPLSEFPPEALNYALLDAETQGEVFHLQSHRIDPSFLEDQYRQSRAAFWIQLMQLWGIRTDPVAVAKFHQATLAEYEKDKQILIDNLLVRARSIKGKKAGSRDTKLAMEHMVSVMRNLQEDLILTETGEELRAEREKVLGRPVTPWEIWETEKKYVNLSEDAVLATADPLLLSYQQYGSLQTTLSRAERLYKGTELPLQAQHQTIVATGRTSCRMGEVEPGVSPPSWGFQLQNIPTKPGLRECFIPRPGRLFCSVDYDGMELRAWAQVCLWSVGFSRLAEVLNAGQDPHTELGASVAGITKAQAYELMKLGDKIFKNEHRQTAKIGNFGFQGGMGPKAFRTQARKEYRVKLSLETCKTLRSLWLEEWPEGPAYFEWINSLCGNGLATIQHFLSHRIRGYIKYTVTCNSFFQGLAADAAKAAGWQLAYECYVDTSSPLYGCRIVAFIHDEFIIEVPDHPERAHLAAYRMRQIMVDVAQSWIPQVQITASPALSRKWTKGVKTVHDAHGLLVCGD